MRQGACPLSHCPLFRTKPCPHPGTAQRLSHHDFRAAPGYTFSGCGAGGCVRTSIVFANALENAIQAVRELPVEQRRIICKSVMSPRFMIEILNSYAGEIIFDQRGIPVANKAGHGIGTRSIVAFAEKHNALYRFQAENGWFKLQIVMQCGDRGIP